MDDEDSSSSDEEMIFTQGFLDEYVFPTSPTSRKRSHDSSELEIDEPKRWVEKKARFDDNPEEHSKRRPPEIDLSRLIPCGKVHLGGKAPRNSLFTRPDLAKEQEMATMSQHHDASDEDVIQSIEIDETRKPHVHFQPMHRWDSANSAFKRDNTRNMTNNDISPRQVGAMQNGKLTKRVPTPYYIRETTPTFLKPKMSGNKEAMARIRRKVQMQRRQAKERYPRDTSELSSRKASHRKTRVASLRNSPRALRSHVRQGKMKR